MGLETDAKRIKFGNDFRDFRQQIISARNVGNGILLNIASARASIINDFGDPSPELTEVDALRAAVIAAFQNWANGLT